MIREALDLFRELVLSSQEDRVSKFGTVESVVLPEGCTLKELPAAKSPQPRRFHRFSDMKSLGEWLKRFGMPADTEILADPASAKVSASTCGSCWSTDVVTAQLTFTQEYEQIRALCAGGKSQEQTYRALSRLRHVLGNGDKTMAQLSKLEIKTAGTFSVSVDPRTGARTGKQIIGGVEYPVDLPTEVTFRTSVHNGSPLQYDVICDVFLSLKGTEPTLEFTVRNATQVELASFTDEVNTQLVTLLGDGWLVGYGCLNPGV